MPDRATEVALFRYALIREAAEPALSKADRGRLVRHLAAQAHPGPGGVEVRVARSTLDQWIRAWRAGGFEALKPGMPTSSKPTPARPAAGLARSRPTTCGSTGCCGFAALSPAYAQGWFVALAAKLLEGDPETLKLLAVNPFPESRPRYVRALLYRYRFTTPAERRATGDGGTESCSASTSRRSRLPCRQAGRWPRAD